MELVEAKLLKLPPPTVMSLSYTLLMLPPDLKVKDNVLSLLLAPSLTWLAVMAIVSAVLS